MKILLLANTDWYLFNFRRSLAQALRDAGHDVLLASPAGPYGQRLRDLGFSWVPVPLARRSLNPLRELAFVAWLVRLLREHEVQLVHGFTIKCAVYGALAARWLGLPRVSAVAGMGYVFTSDEPLARLLRPLVRQLMRLALDGRQARLILQNPDDLAWCRQARVVDETRLRLIPGSGVDCQRFQPAPATGNTPLRAVLPARLLGDKGVREFVQAARLLQAQAVPVQCLLAGTPDPGNPASIAEAEVRDWVAEGVVSWLGHVDDMPALLASVDMVVLPSYREGLPKGLIEAAACAKALITTDVPGCRDVVTHEENGLLVPVKQVVPLAAAMHRLATNVELRSKLGQAARARAEREFDERQVIARTLAVYAELLPMP